MNPKRLEFAEAADDAAWDAFVAASPQGTVFSATPFLRSLGAPFRRWVVQGTGGAPLAQVALVEDADGRAVRYPFAPYQGILFAPKGDALPRQRVLDEFRLTEFIVGELTRRYRHLELALSWAFADLRPFLWHNHGVAGAPVFRTTPRYTALLDLDAISIETYPADVRACRRQELRKASAFETGESTDVATFLDLYGRTFARQDIALGEDRLDLVRSITVAALEQGYGRLSACRTPEGIAAMALFLYDRTRAYYLMAANDPAQRNSGASTRLMFDNIAEAKRRGLHELDFVGVNSPARGDFKLSFNPALALYCEVSLAEPPR
jgi:hypothetical protein